MASCLATKGVFMGLVLCILLALTQLSSCSPEREKRQISCDHPLRLVRPELFTHCGSSARALPSTCTYSSSGPWSRVPNSVVAVLVSQCASRKAYSVETIALQLEAAAQNHYNRHEPYVSLVY